jgi:hypothetical protein
MPSLDNLINPRNFPCAAAILRLQIDTAMRVNALSLIDDVELACKAVLDGEQFNRLKDRDGTRTKLAENHPWISKVYEQASNFVHLSGMHFEVSIARNDGDTRMAYLQISGHDPNRPEETYFEAGMPSSKQQTRWYATFGLLGGSASVRSGPGRDKQG